jgi:hypothetical protein
MDNKIVYCSTKRFEGDDAVRTTLTLDMSNVTEAELVEYAVDALVIKWQASIRRKKDAEVPTKATYLVPKPGTRAAAVMSPEDMIAALAKTGMTAEQIEAAIKAKMVV